MPLNKETKPIRLQEPWWTRQSHVGLKLCISQSNVVHHLYNLGKLHLESIRSARHPTVQCGSSPSRPWQIWQVALGEYQVSSASHCPMWFITFMTSAKAFSAAKLHLTLPKYCKTFDSPSYFLHITFSFFFFLITWTISQQ